MKLETNTIILGSGQDAYMLAKSLAAQKIKAALVSKKRVSKKKVSQEKIKELVSGYETFAETVLQSFSGGAGEFTLQLLRKGEKIEIKAARVIVAEENIKIDNFSYYNLKPGDRAVSLDRIDKFVKSKKISDKKAVFLAIKLDSPYIFRQVIEAAIKASDKCKTYIITSNLQILGNEDLYKESLEAGVTYIKLSKMPDISTDSSNKTHIKFRDPLIGQDYDITADIIFVDYTIAPSNYLKKIGQIIGLHTDSLGFIQTGNVHRNVIYTNRKGVFALGPSRFAVPMQDIETETACAIIEALSYEETAGQFFIDTSKCAKCLTCFRACPHKAIALPGPSILSSACQLCGICAAKCPGAAISSDKISIDLPNLPETERHTPAITAFCCFRSAGSALEFNTKDAPKGLNIVKVRCAGSVSEKDILDAFKNGSDGVLILACHNGNCYSENGSLNAKIVSACIKSELENIGIEKERLCFKTVSSCMEKEAVEIIKQFEERLINFGPLF